MKILLTGYNGFVGTHLLNCKHCEILADEFGQIFLAEKDRIKKCIARVKPDGIIHLAAQSSVSKSFQDPKETFDINFYGTLNLLECLNELNFSGKFLFIGSGDVYGISDQLPIDENALLKPRNPYAVSKVAAEALCYQWSKTSDIKLIMARPFNHVGIGQSENFALASFAHQVASIKLGKQEAVINVGDINVTRDFTDVRDVIKSYLLLLDHGVNGEVYNICSGKEENLLNALNLLVNLAKIKIDLKIDSSKLRINEQKRSCGSYNKIHKLVGWEPTIPFEQSLKDILKYYLTNR